MHRQRRAEGLVRAEAAAGDRVTTRLDPVAEVRDRARPEGDVDERVALEDPLALRLRVAAPDGDDEIGLPALAGRGLSQIRGALRSRLLADGARVEHEHVGVVRPGCLTEPE